MKYNLRLSILLLASILIFSCSDNDRDENFGDYHSGIFIVNEGSFGNGTGTIDFINRSADTVVTSIFQKVNESPIGNIAQSLFFYEDYGFIMVNNAEKIEVVNSTDFRSMHTIVGIPQPRNMVEMNDRLFVSAWGDGFVGGVYEISPSTMDVVQSRPFVNGPESILVQNESLYVTRSGGYNRDSIVMILDPADLTIKKEIKVGDNPVSIVKDFIGDLWVLCAGYTDFTNPDNSTSGSLVQLRDDQVIATIEVANGATDLVVDSDGLNLFYKTGGVISGIATRNISTPLSFNEIIVLSNGYSLDIDPETNNLYLGKAKDFVSRGDVEVYTPDGTLIETYQTGIIPGGFAFK